MRKILTGLAILIMSVTFVCGQGTSGFYTVRSDGTNLYTINSAGTNPITIKVSATNDYDIPNAGWVRSLLETGVQWFNSSNAYSVPFYGTNVYYATRELCGTTNRIYIDLTNNTYVGAVISTSKVSVLNSPVTIQSYLGMSGGSANRSLKLKAEIYYTYDGTNLLGDWDTPAQTILDGTNLYQWICAFPTPTLASNAYVVRVFKVTAVTGTPNKPNLSVTVGTNYPSHFAFQMPSSGGSLTFTNAWGAAMPVVGSDNGTDFGWRAGGGSVGGGGAGFTTNNEVTAGYPFTFLKVPSTNTYIGGGYTNNVIMFTNALVIEFGVGAAVGTKTNTMRID